MMHYRPPRGFALAVAAVLIQCGYGTAISADQEREHYAYRTWLHRGELDRAEQGLRSLLSTGLIEGEHRWVLAVDLARIHRLNGDRDRAKTTLAQLAPEVASHPYARLEAAIQNRVGSDEQAAASSVSEFVRLRNELDPRIKQESNYQLALIDFEREAYDNCIRRCDGIIRDIARLDLYQYPDASELRYLMVQSRELKARAEAQLLILQFGDDYFHYRQGRFAQARGDYEKAIEFFRQVQGGILREAATCYTADCILEIGRPTDAAALYRSFIDEEPYGLYRGEAMLKLARLQILHATTRGQLQAAEKLLAETLGWHEEVVRRAPPVSVASIQAVLAQFPPPDNYTSRDNFGNYHRNHAGPATVLNRLTSTWYMQELEVRTNLLHGFVLNELGQRRDAMARFERTLELNDRYGSHILNVGNVPHRLLVEAGNGAFLIPPTAWNSLSREQAVRLHLAFLYLTVDDVDAAGPLFESVLANTTNTSQHEADRAAAVLGRACVSYHRGQTTTALNDLRRFDAQYAKTPLTPLAQIMAANILAGQSGEEPFNEALRRYSDVARGLPGTPYANRAWLSMAVAAYNRSDHETARTAAGRVSSSSAYHGAAHTLSVLIDNSESDVSKQRSPLSRQATGRVVPIARHFVYPGAVDLRYDIRQSGDDDLLRYSIAFSIRAGCALKNFRCATTILEPQAPPTDESPLVFVRVPLLLQGQ